MNVGARVPNIRNINIANTEFIEFKAKFDVAYLDGCTLPSNKMDARLKTDLVFERDILMTATSTILKNTPYSMMVELYRRNGSQDTIFMRPILRGHGSDGVVVDICGPNDNDLIVENYVKCNLVAKITKITKNSTDEVEIARKADSLGVGVRVHDVFSVNNEYLFIITQKAVFSLTQYKPVISIDMQMDIYRLVYTLWSNTSPRIIHSDLHVGNVMINASHLFRLIDFGRMMASDSPIAPLYELTRSCIDSGIKYEDKGIFCYAYAIYRKIALEENMDISVSLTPDDIQYINTLIKTRVPKLSDAHYDPLYVMDTVKLFTQLV